MKEVELTEQILSAINIGQTANVVHAHLRPILSQLSSDIVSKLKSDFRAGKFDPIAMQVALAELVAYEKIENSLKGQTNKAAKALKQTQEGETS